MPVIHQFVSIAFQQISNAGRQVRPSRPRFLVLLLFFRQYLFNLQILSHILHQPLNSGVKDFDCIGLRKKVLLKGLDFLVHESEDLHHVKSGIVILRNDLFHFLLYDLCQLSLEFLPHFSLLFNHLVFLIFLLQLLNQFCQLRGFLVLVHVQTH